MAREIYLANGKGVALVDDEDYELVSQYRWSANSKGYATAWLDGSPKLLHRFLMGEPPFEGATVDHTNGDKLDNRRSNLRWATYGQNLSNRNAPENCTSRYRGVSWHKKAGKWAAKITVEGRTIYLGLYVDEVEAARAYDGAAIEYFGEFARLNFPDELAA